MASHYSVIQKYAQTGRYVNNEVIQALSETLQDIANQFCASIIQLEMEHSNGTLSLQNLLYYVRPNMQTLGILANLVGKIGQHDLSGGQILSLLHEHVTLSLGDSKAKQMLIELTERAAVPYFEILHLWILKGVIIDRCKQFFIVDHDGRNAKSIDTDDTARYWESRYTIVHERIPKFVEPDADIILRTGKYLNVIRQCGHLICPPDNLTHFEYSASNQKHSAFIKSAYHYASKTLLEMLCGKYMLMGHITAVKRYFLLQQGDLITQFMDASEEELSKELDKVAPVRLDNLLQLTMRMSSAKNDPCLDNLQCDLFTTDLVTLMSKISVIGANFLSATQDENGNLSTEATDLTALECFAFRYNVQWPVSIVLNQWALLQYQSLFRLLFYCKHVERQLCKIWIENTHTRKLVRADAVETWRGAFALRQRMLDAVQHLENYMMIEVIEPNWNTLLDKMKTVQNIEDVIHIHQDFLHICMHNCMLSYPDMLRNVMNLFNVCLKFCKYIQSDATNGNTLTTSIDEFSTAFDGHLIGLLQRINDMTATVATKLNSLVCRINFNGFYSDILDKMTAARQLAAQTIKDGSQATGEITYMGV